MARKLTSLLVALMLFVGPTLCIGGLIEHACDCGDAGTEMHGEHEDSCSGDPCEALMVPQERNRRNLLDIQVPWFPARDISWDAKLASVMWSWSMRPPLLPDRCNLPYAQSDRPQLI